MATVDTSVNELVINKLTQAQYDNLAEKSPTELYFVTDAEMLPDQADNAGKFLATDGENLSWEKAVKNNATISSDDALAIGLSSRVSTNRTIAVGHYSQAHSGGAAAFGGSAYASASNSVAIGTSAITYGDNSVALGHNSKTDHNPDENYGSENSVAIGYSAISKGNSQIIIGDTASGSGNNAIVVGKGAIANGENAVVIGSSALSNSPNGANVVIGPGSKVDGYSFHSTAIGIGTQAQNYDATAIGRNIVAGAQYSFAAGYAAQTDPTYCNDSLGYGQPVVAVGFGAISRSNDSIAIGRDVYADGPFSIVIGQNSTVGNEIDYGIAVGKETQVAGSEGIAVGHSAKSARHGIALGTRAKVNEFGGVAIGLNTDSDGTNAVTIGNQSYAHGGNSVALGSSAIVDYGADKAIQLGTGTNSDANTLQFLDYKLLYENGTIPYERLSEYSPSNGQVLTYDSNEGALIWSEASGGISEVNWGDITGNINNQTDLKNKFDNINNNIQSLDIDMSTNYQNLNNKFDDAIQNLEQDFSTSTKKLETDIRDAEGRLQTQIDTLSSIGQFLAIWDCDTGIARYLDEGFEYQVGNYFIIGTVAEGEGAVNYMPDGNMYPGKVETTEEDVRVSDMWFYDGEHWIYLANHERSIAVDADLDISSSNPVENKTVTSSLNALDDKLGVSVSEINTAIEELQNRPVPIAVPQLASVDVLQVSENERRQRRALGYGDWKGNYSDIVVTLNLDKEAIIQNMYDLYVTISRFKTNKNLTYTEYNEGGEEAVNYRNIPKFSVMNDLRQKTDRRLYCWRFLTDSSYPETNPMRYCYFYTKDNYNDNVDTLWEEDPSIGLWSGYSSSAGIGTCFNAIVWNEHGFYTQMFYDDYFENGSIERYEEGDIDSFANVGNSSLYPEYNISNYVTKIECRKYTKDGQNYFFWAEKDEWEHGGYGSCVGDYLDPIPNGIPKHMEELVSAFDEVRQLEENGFVFVEKRPDLNYKRVEDFDALLEALQDLTFQGKYVDNEGRPTYWNCYWFDYPVMPIMLKDCEVRKHISDDTGTSWIKLEELVKAGDTHKLRDDLPIELKLPYDSYYLWMRMCALQKRCAYGDYSNWLDEEGRGIDLPMWPRQKHDLYRAVREYNILGKRAFSRDRQGYRNNSGMGKVSEYIHFNICTHNDVAAGRKSKSTPIQKKLNIDFNANSGLRD